MCLRSMLAVISFSAVVLAQALPAGKVLSVTRIEDPELYYAFFYHHQGLIDTQQAAKAAAPQSAPLLDQQMATQLSVDVKELPAVNANTQQIIQSHANLLAERKAYNFTAIPKSGQPTAKQMNSEFELRRVRITVEGAQLLSQKISAASWAGLHAYITGPFKTAVYGKH